MILALAGNPNCGKTTLFNALTGANARTGNFPGVTVTRSESVCRARPEITLVDLPGVYALRPYSDEERVTRSYLLGGAADAVISIADATCPARSLYLTLQLLELGVPVVLALNVMDALRAGGGSVDTAGLARALGIPVVPVSAALGEGLDALLDAAVQAAHGPPPDPWRALVSGPVQTCVRTIARLLAPAAHAAGLPPVFAATQWLDGGSTLHAPAAAETAAARLGRESGRYTREEKLLEEAAQVLGLKTPPRVIESYDISNWGDGSSVCGMVVFKDGKPYRAGYRRFKMRTVAGTDDYASMAETLSRRAAEYEAARRGEKPDNETNQFATMPDLLLIDGGRGQVSAVKQALRGTALEHVPTFGMVKDDHHRTRAIVDDAGGEIAINRHRNIFTFVTNIQDETHRYANDYRKRMMHKKSYAATLTELPGVGPKTSAALLAHFKTVTAVKQASISDLEEVKGISHAKAENIYNALRQ